MADYPNACGAGEDMKVDGKVSIGRSTASEELHVYGSGDIKAMIQSTNNHAAVYILNDKGGFTLQVEDATGRFRIYDVGGGGEVLSIPHNDGGKIGIGTASPASKLEVDGGDIEVDDSSCGLILRSPDDTRWRVTIDNSGNLNTNEI